jgi:hypothetical protein
MNRWPLVVGAGLATLLAACDVTGPFRVLDDARPVLSVRLRPDTLLARQGDTVTFVATPLGAGDRVVSESPITWAIGDPSVARSLGGGRILCLVIGDSEVLATAGGRRARGLLQCRERPASGAAAP